MKRSIPITTEELTEMGYTYFDEYGITSRVVQAWQFWEGKDDFIVYDPVDQTIVRHLKKHQVDGT